jgi:thiosulfate/3-mercaptopyruvate sulfurtransferase
VDCHSGEAMHASGSVCTECHSVDDPIEKTAERNRYSGEQSPSCESCHPEMGAWNDINQNHQIHKDRLACQVCHSVSYTSCDGCHVAISAKTGNPFFETQDDYLSFFIGRNPSPNYHRPYEYVVVRHVPASHDSYAFYAEDLLPDFNALPTWVYATPHNIQKQTPQNESCNACHGNPAIFLTQDKIKPEEVEANQDVVVDQIPAPVEEP